ncbi:MAG TPA: glycerol-3-phosphate 1-O-acyltransferase [Gammaproteobacteria bacterium]|nr:glycerol-3-phosphate 1-O-acyltransferase [Gammaproteobacteria bacterium]
MEYYPTLLLAACLAYLTGSISTAIITCKLMGLEDPRKTGSNNPGATNVLRHGGKKAAIITLIGDSLKGLIPILVGIYFQVGPLALALIALFALLGHIFPVYYGFKGGKGVATYYGVILGINWQIGLIALATWLLVAKLLKISSLSALISIFITPLMFSALTHSIEITGAITLMSLLVFWRHKKNIKSLLQGSEARIGKNQDTSEDHPHR